jgi:uncharacterized radical SAM superfamily Fe-S cluster-containing enzyme
MRNFVIHISTPDGRQLAHGVVHNAYDVRRIAIQATFEDVLKTMDVPRLTAYKKVAEEFSISPKRVRDIVAGRK